MRGAAWVVVLTGMVGLGGCATGKTQFAVIKVTPMTAVASMVATPAAPVATPSPVSDQPQVVPPAGPQAYTVQPDESLWRISRRFYADPLRYHEIARDNHIANPDLIHPGQVLMLANLANEPGPQGNTLTAGKTAVVRPQPLAATPAATPTVAATPVFTVAQIPRRPNRAFGPGEKLLFSVEYFGVSAGYASLNVERGPQINQRATYHLFATARTHPAFEWFFKVRDQIDSYLDIEGVFPWRYEKHLREGGYSNDSVMIYEQLSQRVIKDEGRTIVPAAAWTQDVLSEFYYFRTLELKVGQSLTIPVMADDGKNYELLVKVLRKETVTVPAGKFNCVVVQPLLKFESVFQNKGTIEIWVTDDARKVPVLIKSAIVIGTINIVLRNAEVVDVK